MAYFSNGTEGLDWQVWNCDICKHNEENGCPLLLVSEIFNYDQLSKGQEKLKKTMDILMPRKDSKNLKCGMFVPNGDIAGQGKMF